MNNSPTATAARPTPSRALLAAYAGIAAVDTWLAGSTSTRAHRWRRVTKPLLMPTLAAATLTDSGGVPHSPTGRLGLAGLAAGWVGDLALLREGTPAFAAGAGAFGVGHVAYSAAYRSLPHRSLTRSPLTRGLAGLWLITAPLLSLAAARQERVLGPAVAGYSALLCSMAAQAGAVTAPVSAAARRDLAAGALLFVASDTMLGAFKFLPGSPDDDNRESAGDSDSHNAGRRAVPARAESLVMASYTLAQFLIARGLRRATAQD